MKHLKRAIGIWFKRRYWHYMIAEVEHQMMFFEIRYSEYIERITRYEQKLEQLK